MSKSEWPFGKFRISQSKKEWSFRYNTKFLRRNMNGRSVKAVNFVFHCKKNNSNNNNNKKAKQNEKTKWLFGYTHCTLFETISVLKLENK